jgi:hypothetical protein
LAAGVICIVVPALVAAGEDAPSAASLAFVAAEKEFRFDTGVLAGTLRSGGKSLGLGPVVHKATGTALAGPYGLFSHYRLLTADERFGGGAWDWPSEARLLPDGAVEVQWRADAGHPFDMQAVYRWRNPKTLDVTTTVTARKELRSFEVFLASYFQSLPQSLVYAKPGEGADARPAFLPADRAAGVWQMFPRDAEAVRLIQDGRWKRPPNPVEWTIRPPLAAPLAMRRDEKTGLTAVVMVPRGDCFAVATPFNEEGHRSLYLSLLGRDLKVGDTATARARLVVDRGISDEQAVALYEAYVKDLATAAEAGK